MSIKIIRSYQSIICIIQRFSDVVLLLGVLWLSVWFSNYSWSEKYAIVALLGTILYYLIAEISGLYTLWHGTRFSSELNHIIWIWLGAVMTLLLIAFVSKISANYSRQAMLTWFFGVPLVIGLWRLFFRFLIRNQHFFGLKPRKIAIVGVNDLGKRLVKIIQKQPWRHMDLVGFYDNQLTDNHLAESVGNLETLIEKGKEGKIDEVYITLPLRDEKQIKVILSNLADAAITVYIVPDLFVFELLHSQWQNIGGLPVISIHGMFLHDIEGLLKRVEDVVLSLSILSIVAVPMFIIGLSIKLTSPGPILFKQRRYGLNGEKISVWKFRTMTVCENDASFKQTTHNDKRITRLGTFLRRTSLDEFPQFINVLQGQMSVVGPRPHPILLNEQFRQRIPKYMLRHVVKPGITGWAQINGFRGETDTLEKMEKRIDYDLHYIENWSLWLDIKIVILTIIKWSDNKNVF